MKKHLLKIALSCSFALFFTKVKAQELQFLYDGAGNQIQRQFVCVNCTTFPPALNSLALPQDATTSTTNPDNNNNASNASRKITAYPNPFTQVLNLSWYNGTKYYVSRIEVYSSKGTTVYGRDYKDIEMLTRTESIPFDKQIPGFYFVKVLYSDGKQEVVKVIKIDK